MIAGDEKKGGTITNSWGVAPGYVEYRLWRKRPTNVLQSNSLQRAFLSTPELGFLHSLLSTLYSLEPPAPPPAKALGAKGGKEEVGREKLEVRSWRGDGHSGWPKAIVNIARGIAPGKRSPIPGVLPQAMLNIAFGEKDQQTFYNQTASRALSSPPPN